MEISISDHKIALGQAAAGRGAELIISAIEKQGQANIIVATGTSQFEMLSELTKKDIDWSRVTAFHLDEYVGIPITHPASFRKYLKERFVDVVAPAAFHYIDGEVDPLEECSRLNSLIEDLSIDVAFIGIGENAHLAFNDPPADFEVELPYILVNLDGDCRNQQYQEGWFPSIEEVPETAISMSVKQILKSTSLICSVPGPRKAEAVRKTMAGEVKPEIPASILSTHGDAWIYLDKESASLL